MSRALIRFVTVFLAVILMLVLPVPRCAAADEDSDTEAIGKQVTVGVLVLLLAVLVIIGFREDMDRRAEASLPLLPEGADAKIFVDMDDAPASESEMETAATRVGVRLRF